MVGEADVRPKKTLAMTELLCLWRVFALPPLSLGPKEKGMEPPVSGVRVLG
jgi:hypothetical protein